ncbi:MAG: penicillin-binding protein 2, partial [Spirochaetaceae bacterium]|nr:penicillin-binding protein 2 [Spirochaetaceae bacterium]
MKTFISRRRLCVFLALVFLFFAAVIGSYAVVMLGDAPAEPAPEITTQRGTIFDRNGKILAIQTTLYNVGITKSDVRDVEVMATHLAPILEMSPSDISSRITNAPSNFIFLKKKVSQTVCDALRKTVRDYKLRGLTIDSVISRTYPFNTLAAQLIGFMGDDGEGLSGIERSYQPSLAPRFRDTADHAVSHAVGYNIVLTIDADLQYRLEQIARASIAQTQAESMMILAADVDSGEILSYISLPSPDLNTYPAATNAQRRDRPALDSYEPGSVFKIYSVAAFLELNGIRDADRFLCDGVFDISSTNGERVRINCLDRHGWVTAREALEFSCNDAIAQMSQTVQSEAFLAKLREFGFGSRTGIPLPGETAGLLKTTADRFWSARSKPTIAMGQEVGVSALQMVQAASAIANGGNRVNLSCVSRIVSADGNILWKNVPQTTPNVISPGTAAQLLSYMETTAQVGTGYRASIGDVPIGVKTGTAQMQDPETGGYSDTDFLSNCMAVFPADDPEIILYIVINKAQGETYAGRIVAPVIAEASNVIIDYLGLSRRNAPVVQHTGVLQIP